MTLPPDDSTPEQPSHSPAPLSALIAQFLQADSNGHAIDRNAFIEQHLEHAESLRDFFSNHDAMKGGLGIEVENLSLSVSSTAADGPNPHGLYCCGIPT